MDAISTAVDHLLRAVGDPRRDLEGIGPTHPDYARACLVHAATGVLAKSPDALPGVARAVQGMAGGSRTDAMSAHADAARAWLAGDPVAAAERYAGRLASDPHDLLALRLAQSCYFFLGWHDRLCALTEMVISNWRGDVDGFAFVRAMASFAHAENGNIDRAEALGRQALAFDAACPLGVHAVAHAFAESGRAREGARWMRSRRRHWAGESRMRTHNAWHLAMFDLQCGHVDSALELLDRCLLPASLRSPLDACDATALMRGLANAGVNVAHRWHVLSDAFERRLTPGFWPFVDLHAAVAHAVTGERSRLARLARHLAACADTRGFHAFRARHLALPGMRAITAWAADDREEAAVALRTFLPLLHNVGGSRVQLDLFRDLAREVCPSDPNAAAGNPAAAAGATVSRPSRARRASRVCAKLPAAGRTPA